MNELTDNQRKQYEIIFQKNKKRISLLENELLSAMDRMQSSRVGDARIFSANYELIDIRNRLHQVYEEDLYYLKELANKTDPLIAKLQFGGA